LQSTPSAEILRWQRGRYFRGTAFDSFSHIGTIDGFRKITGTTRPHDLSPDSGPERHGHTAPAQRQRLIGVLAELTNALDQLTKGELSILERFPHAVLHDPAL